MKPTQIKNAFASIAEEAGKDEKLRQAVSSRIGAEIECTSRDQGASCSLWL